MAKGRYVQVQQILNVEVCEDEEEEHAVSRMITYGNDEHVRKKAPGRRKGAQ